MTSIVGIQKPSNYQYSHFLLNLDNNLIEELDSILKIKEDLWKLKSRINWLTDGDANTKFFHTSTLNRRRRKRILSPKDDTGNWQHDQQDSNTPSLSILAPSTPLHTYNHPYTPHAQLAKTHTVQHSKRHSNFPT